MHVLTPRIEPKVLLPIAILLAGAVVGMSSILAWVGSVWYSFFGQGVYSHGYLALGLSIWMGWVFWRRNPPAKIGPDWRALAPLVLLVLAMSAMELLYIGATRAMLLPLLFLAATALVFGFGAARVLLLPALFIYSALLPFWMFNPMLQEIATRAVGFLMSFSGTPFLIEGNFVHIPAGTFEIASGCSGLSFLVSGTVLTVYFSAMYLQHWSHRLLLVAAAMAAALFANWMRIWTIILIGQATQLQHWLINDHLSYGWVLFILFFTPVLFFATLLEKREIRESRRAQLEETAQAPPPRARDFSGTRMLRAAAVGALLLAIPRLFASEVTAGYTIDRLPLPEQIAGVARKAAEQGAWQPQFRNAREGAAIYLFDGSTVEVFRAVYPEQDRTRHLFRNREALFGRGWRPVDHRLVNASVGSEIVRVNEYRGYIAGRERVIWAWYEVAGRPVATRLGAKLVEAQAFFRGRNDGVVVAVSAECEAGCEGARERLYAFLSAAGAELRWQPD
ncbi:exosortase C-terminal domain/associated protein EpsI [Thioalkalivibrio sp. XN279]|uniref:exosortase C-terminal domain/associated protein EpsI n=1 Tax=Thioalkalivibrio sp. XN279 TaxID=2714953 RepID=UPI00140E5784|nr:exosortase C-terminal domain/associated protein EpsI [Thioalkalivibrio sp. XN279]NHA15380.1 EpsI family protein [Thioalkalivibrio sp. XN279]